VEGQQHGKQHRKKNKKDQVHQIWGDQQIRLYFFPKSCFASLYFAHVLVFLSTSLDIRGFAAKDFTWSCVKSLLPPAAAKFYIETTLDSLILLRKINESSVVSNLYLVRSAVKNLFTQPLKYNLARSATKRLFTPPKSPATPDNISGTMTLLKRYK
jgi:hypothetical protein